MREGKEGIEAINHSTHATVTCNVYVVMAHMLLCVSMFVGLSDGTVPSNTASWLIKWVLWEGKQWAIKLRQLAQ